MRETSRESVSISDLRPARYNPRSIDDASIAALEKSVQRFGLVQDIVVNCRNMTVIGGHQRLKVLKNLNEKTAPVVFVDLDETEEKALNIALNSPHLAGVFTDELQALLDEIRAGDAVLMHDLRLDELLDQGKPKGSIGDPDFIPDAPLEPRTQIGDLYEMEGHRLLCGDSTNAENVGRLLGDSRAVMSLTDPPYSVGYSVSFSKRERNGDHVGNQGAYQESQNGRPLLESVLSLAPDIVVMTYPVDRHFFDLADALRTARYESVRELVWVKQSPTFHPGSTYQQAHEPILVLRRSGTRFPKSVPSDAKTVLLADRPARHGDHPTEKPISLWGELLTWHTTQGDLVHEPFGGSGTTVIACEMHGRTCYAMEISPVFCDVIVQRWEAYTGKTAVLRRG